MASAIGELTDSPKKSILVFADSRLNTVIRNHWVLNPPLSMVHNTNRRNCSRLLFGQQQLIHFQSNFDKSHFFHLRAVLIERTK